MHMALHHAASADAAGEQAAGTHTRPHAHTHRFIAATTSSEEPGPQRSYAMPPILPTLRMPAEPNTVTKPPTVPRAFAGARRDTSACALTTTAISEAPTASPIRSAVLALGLFCIPKAK